MVEVIQADRDAAAALIEARPMVEHPDIIRHGGADDGAFVQAFARHRLTSTQPAPAFPREEVAAIVDPAAWEQRDRHLHKAASAGRRSEALDWLRRADDVVAPSLRAADAIAALLQGKQP